MPRTNLPLQTLGSLRDLRGVLLHRLVQLLDAAEAGSDVTAQMQDGGVAAHHASLQVDERAHVVRLQLLHCLVRTHVGLVAGSDGLLQSLLWRRIL